jgi:hypothetical protein
MSFINESVCTVTYTLCNSFTKILQVGVECKDDPTPYVMLSKTGFNNIKLTAEEWKALVNNEVLASTSFTSQGIMYEKCALMLSSNLCIRADKVYDKNALVLQRSGGDEKNNVSVWFTDVSWFKLVAMMPLVNHLLEQRINWIADIKNVYDSLVKYIVENKPQAVHDASLFAYERFKNVFSSLNYNDIVPTLVSTLDVYKTLHEICIEMGTHVMNDVRNVSIL